MSKQTLGFPDGSVGKETACSAGDTGYEGSVYHSPIFFSIRILDFVIFIVKFSLFIREINLLSVIYFLQVHPFTFDYVFSF